VKATGINAAIVEYQDKLPGKPIPGTANLGNRDLTMQVFQK
jgi:hypothetical protein